MDDLTPEQENDLAAYERKKDRRVLCRLIHVVVFGSNNKSEGRDTDDFDGLRYIWAAFVALTALLIGRGYRENPRSVWLDSISIAYTEAGTDYWGEAIGQTLTVDIKRWRAWVDSI